MTPDPTVLLDYLRINQFSGSYAGGRAFIPRIVLTCADEAELPFDFRVGLILVTVLLRVHPKATKARLMLQRRQFPVKLCFAMTINKAQSQTVDRVGIALPAPVFTHCQLYVGLSRCGSAAATRVRPFTPSS